MKKKRKAKELPSLSSNTLQGHRQRPRPKKKEIPSAQMLEHHHGVTNCQRENQSGETIIYHSIEGWDPMHTQMPSRRRRSKESCVHTLNVEATRYIPTYNLVQIVSHMK